MLKGGFASLNPPYFCLNYSSLWQREVGRDFEEVDFLTNAPCPEGTLEP